MPQEMAGKFAFAKIVVALLIHRGGRWRRALIAAGAQLENSMPRETGAWCLFAGIVVGRSVVWSCGAMLAKWRFAGITESRNVAN